MPTLNISIAQGTHDGHATWDNRLNANGTHFNTGLQAGLGTHFAESSILSRFFIFRFGDGSFSSGIPQGTQINSVKLNLRFNNGVIGSILHNHVYLCVENNLDPTGTGAIVNGTLGTQAYQRLGRQSAATTIFSNRCGPTHNGNLSAIGRSVRDSQALIYKAYADSRDLPSGTWQLTDDFAGALQALVNDPSWNGDSQYVMIHMFSDTRISGGSTGGVGYLGGISWASGQTGSAGEGNGPSGAQTYFYDQGPGTYPPQLQVDYTTTSLKAQGGGSTSSGNIRFQPALCIGRQRGERAEIVSGSPIIPKQSTGAHDLPITGMNTMNPYDVSWNNGSPVGARLKWDLQRPGRKDGNSILIEDYLNWTPQFWWDINAYQTYFSTLKTYSLRFYHRYERDAIINANPHVVSFNLGGSNSFKIEMKQYVVNYPTDTMNELRITGPGDTTGWTINQYRPPTAYGFYRYELQVDENTTPKVRLRVYLNDSTTPIDTLQANPTTVEIDKVIFGDFENQSFYLFSFHVADFEMWSDYLLNRQYPDSMANTLGTPYIPQQWAWSEYDGGTSYTELEDLGTISSIDPNGSNVVITSPSDALTLEDTYSEVWKGDTNSHTLHSDISYGLGTARKLDLYIPTGTPPGNGWPVIVWTHGGFWISGMKTDIPAQFVTDCTLRGYAVASVEYVLGGVNFAGLGQPYPSWDPNINSGRYPSFILNYKEAAYWLQNTGASIYDLDPNRFIAMGHSAGGYNALGAAVSKGLTNDGGGRNLTLAGNTVAFGCPNVADPDFKGAYILAGPTNLNALKAWDPSHPSYPYLGTGVGIINATARVFRGEQIDNGGGDTNNVGIDDFILLNAANVPSVHYAWGRADHLVVSAEFTPHSQQAKLEAAFTSVSGSLPPTTTYTSHEVPDALHHTILDKDFDYEHFFRWLKQVPGM